jgi:hypothetical protein
LKKALAKNVAILVTTLTLISLTSGPASAIEKPKDLDGVYIEADVNVKDPRVSSDENGKEKFFNPCNNWMVAVAPPGFVWSGEFRWLACSFWGANDIARKTYQWNVSLQSSSMACAQAYGFKTDRTPFWAGIGCGYGGGAQVLWGEVAAYPKMKFKSLSGLAVPIYWN